jgi:succinate dehydrogenase / fumarate reductase membrane anchor subunit
MVNRVVVGAHYGLGGWLAQRITGAIMALYTVILIVVFMRGQPITYGVWVELFDHAWMRIGTLLFAASLGWHAWVGVRDIIMDYVKADGLRLALQVLVLLLVAVYLGWTIEILWR